MKLQFIKLAELKNNVKNIKNKSSSVDRITIRIPKLPVDVIVHRFLQTINASSENSPETWKISTLYLL